MTAIATRSTPLPSALVRLLWALLAVGIVTVVAGLIVDAPRIWANGVVVSSYVLGLALGSAFLLAVYTVMRGGWLGVVQRVPEALMTTLWLPALLTAAGFIGLTTLYPWAGEERALLHLDLGKGDWLSVPFFIARQVGYFVIWALLLRAWRRNSTAQDRESSSSYPQRQMRVSALFLVLFALTTCGYAFDTFMSLEPQFFSTIFGVYLFAANFLAAIAVVILFVILLHRSGVLAVKPDHYHNLGKLLLAFSTFWAYIWISQYLLIWYANLPEETPYYVLREQPGWQPLFVVNVALNWAIPFLVLLPQASKRNPRVLGWAALLIVGGQWLDRFLMIFPTVTPGGPQFGWQEIGMAVGAAAAITLAFARGFRAAAPVPVNDPYLVESTGLQVV